MSAHEAKAANRRKTHRVWVVYPSGVEEARVRLAPGPDFGQSEDIQRIVFDRERATMNTNREHTPVRAYLSAPSVQLSRYLSETPVRETERNGAHTAFCIVSDRDGHFQQATENTPMNLLAGAFGLRQRSVGIYVLVCLCTTPSGKSPRNMPQLKGLHVSDLQSIVAAFRIRSRGWVTPSQAHRIAEPLLQNIHVFPRITAAPKEVKGRIMAASSELVPAIPMTSVPNNSPIMEMIAQDIAKAWTELAESGGDSLSVFKDLFSFSG